MEWTDIPATNDYIGEAYLKSSTVVRNQIMDAIDEYGRDANPDIVKRTLDTILSRRMLDVLGTWSKQKPQLEQMLIWFFLEFIVGKNMEPERQTNHRYMYSLSTEGRCLEQRHRGNPYGFIKIGKPIPNRDSNGDVKLYTYDQLLNDWRNIFVLDEEMEKNEELRERYTPQCRHKTGIVDALILTTQHQLKIVDPDRISDSDGGYVEGTDISFCRIKSDPRYLTKLAEYFTNSRVNLDPKEIAKGRLFKPRESIDDGLAALLRVHEKYEGVRRWGKTMDLIGYISEGGGYISERGHETLDNVIRLKGYSQKEADEQRRLLEISHREISRLVKRPDLDFIPEPLPGGKSGKFAEVWLPYNGNKICLQVYHDLGKDSYTDIQGDEKSVHVQYKTDGEEKTLKHFTAWHWDIIRRLVPYFLSKYHLDPIQKLYEQYFSLEHFKKPK